MASSILISASMMCADFTRLGDQVRALERARCDRLHFDIMDGHFVPNLTLSAYILKSLRPLTALPFDAHLMVTDPAHWIGQFADAGADTITVHAEAARDLKAIAQKIRAAGASPGISLNPDMPVEKLARHLRHFDLVLMMSVFAGFAGQSFVRGSVGRVGKMRRLLDRAASRAMLQVDGGIRESNIGALARAGAHCAILGSGLFLPGKSFRATIRALRTACR